MAKTNIKKNKTGFLKMIAQNVKTQFKNSLPIDKNIQKGRKIFQKMEWLKARPWCYNKERNSLLGQDAERLLRTAFGNNQYRVIHHDGFTPPQNGMGVTLDRGGYYESKSVIFSASLDSLKNLLKIWDVHFIKNITSDGDIQKWSGGVTLQTFPDCKGEYSMIVR